MRNALTILFVFSALLIGGIARAHNAQDLGCHALMPAYDGNMFVLQEELSDGVLYVNPATRFRIGEKSGVVSLQHSQVISGTQQVDMFSHVQFTGYLCSPDHQPAVVVVPLVSR